MVLYDLWFYTFTESHFSQTSQNYIANRGLPTSCMFETFTELHYSQMAIIKNWLMRTTSFRIRKKVLRLF